MRWVLCWGVDEGRKARARESAARALQHPSSLSASAPLPGWHSGVGAGPEEAAAQRPSSPPHSPPLLGVNIDNAWDSDEGDGLVHIGGGFGSIINFEGWGEEEEEALPPLSM